MEITALHQGIMASLLALEKSGDIPLADLQAFSDLLDEAGERGMLNHGDHHTHAIRQAQKVVWASITVAKQKTKYKVAPLTLTPSFKEFLQFEASGNQPLGLLDIVKIVPQRQAPDTLEGITTYLSKVLIPHKRIASERDLEVFLSGELASFLGSENVHRQYVVGGFLALKTDLDLFNGRIGIELKVASSLDAAEMQRLIGQAVYYDRRVYKGSLIVLVAGSGKITAPIAELGAFIQELGARFVYRQAIKL
jgi:hypothetical protein